MKADVGVDEQIHVFFPRTFYPRRTRPQYPLDRRLAGPQNRCGFYGEEKFLTPPGLELRFLSPAACSQSLYRFAIPNPLLVFKDHDMKAYRDTEENSYLVMDGGV
jgi:hypothetical protein